MKLKPCPPFKISEIFNLLSKKFFISSIDFQPKSIKIILPFELLNPSLILTVVISPPKSTLINLSSIFLINLIDLFDGKVV